MDIIFNLTALGTVTAIFIIIIKKILNEKIKPKWHVYLWLIVALRLIIPIMPESDFSLFNNMPSAEIIMSENAYDKNELANLRDNKAENLDIKEENESYIKGNIAYKSPLTSNAYQGNFSLSKNKIDIIKYIWISGAVLLAVYLSIANYIFVRRKKAFEDCKDPLILEVFNEAKISTGVFSNKITLKKGDTVPMLHGIFKPAIIFPAGYSPEELRHIFIHELNHYKHRDTTINLICCIFLCVYWFNPVIWYCFFAVQRDLEILCDENSIKASEEKKEYAKVLFKTVTQKRSFIAVASPMQNGEKQVTKRIKYIANSKKQKLWISVISLIVLAFAGVLCLTNPINGSNMNIELDGGYYFSIPQEWIKAGQDESKFFDNNGENIGGIYAVTLPEQFTLSKNMKENEIITSNLPKQIKISDEKIIDSDGKKLLLLTSEEIKCVFAFPETNKQNAYVIWTKNKTINERRLIKVAKTLTKSPYPEGYQPETLFDEDWDKTAKKLLNLYFNNYVSEELPIYSDISGYEIKNLTEVKDAEDSWGIIYPNSKVYSLDYSLDIEYPDYYIFAGGGFDISEGNQKKIYKNQLAVFNDDGRGNAVFLGFVHDQDLAERGLAGAVLKTINYSTIELRAKALLENKTLYIGNHIKVGGINSNLPLSNYTDSMELQTKKEPYGLTINYDMKALGKSAFVSRPDMKMTDSSGWEINPYIFQQLYQNSIIMLSLIDNCESVTFKIEGISETGASYNYTFNADRTFLEKEFGQDFRENTASFESYCDFLAYVEDTVYMNKIVGKGL